MQHTLAAVFDKQNQAEEALEDLVALGLPRDEVHLSQSTDVSQTQAAASETTTGEKTFGTGFRSFFTDVFSSLRGEDDAALYSEAVRRGNYVLTVTVPEDDLVDPATNAIERHAPVNIEEQASQWKSGGWAAPESMRQDGTQTSRQPSGSKDESMSIPVVEEELKVGKRQVQRGGVRIYQHVTERPVERAVNLREEHVVVERTPVDQPATAADLSGLKEGSIEVREMAEEPVVEKTARVVEEVRVGKEVSERQEQVRDTLRGTEVEVEHIAKGSTSAYQDLDNDYRAHWTSNFASSGMDYEDYLPAYQYGSSIAGSRRYQGRDWNDIESDVRANWESRNPDSAWEKFKAAVRHGWERMIS